MKKIFLILFLVVLSSNANARDRHKDRCYYGTNYFDRSYGDIRFDRYAPKFINEHGYLVPSSGYNTYVQSNNCYNNYELYRQQRAIQYTTKAENVNRRCPGLIGFVIDFLFGF